MRGSTFIGRVGGLAVALGIGALAGTALPAAAWASPDGASDVREPSPSAGPSRPGTGQPSRQPRGASGRPAREDLPRSAQSEPSDGVNRVQASRDNDNPVESALAARSPKVPITQWENATRDLTAPAAVSLAPAAVAAPLPQSVAAPVLAEQKAPSVAAPAATSVSTFGDVAAAAMPEPAAGWGTGPVVPLSAAASWVMVAAARRELEGPAAAASTSTGQLVNAAAAQQEVPSFGDIIQYTLFHKPATANPTQAPGQSPNGTVTGNLNAATTTAATPVYTVAQGPSTGRAVVAADGTYTYTPDRDFPVAGGTDSFQVTIDNAAPYRLTGIAGAVQGIVHTLAQLIGLAGPDTVTVTVAVTVAPITQPPTVTGVTVNTPDAGGVVTGQITASDPEGGLVTYSAPTATPKGDFSIDADTGSFTFTPSAAARHAAARTGAAVSNLQQSVTVTVTDPYGATASQVIQLAIAPINTAPVAGTPTVGAPDPLSGVATGTVIATDPDNDQLTYSAPSTTAKGSVTIDAATGSFTYTPTAQARDAAAANGATQADRRDTVTVTVTDGYGGSTEIPVAVAVAPAPGSAPTVTFKPGSASVAEGNSGTTQVPVTVRLSTTYVAPVTVYYSVVEQPLLSTAATPGVDFREESGSVTIAAGQTEGTINVTLYGDTDYETDELVRVELTGATNGVIDANPSNYRKTVTVTNDDLPSGALVTFKPGSVSVAEGNSGTTLVPVTVQLSGASGGPVTVYYSVVEQPLLSTAATPGVDFREESGSVTIPAGQTEGTFTVMVYGDAEYETDELVRVELTGASGGTLDLNPSNYRKTVTISNDDQPAGSVVSFKPGSVSIAEGNSGSKTVPVTVQLSSAAAAPVTVSYSVVEQPLLSTTATPGVDFRQESGSVTIPVGQTEGSFNVTVYGDTAYETDELVRVELTGVSGGVLDPNPSNYRKTVTITNDDPVGSAATLV